MACSGGCGASGEFLLTAGTALAIQMSRELSEEEMNLLAAFLNVLADQLILLALKCAPGECACGQSPDEKSAAQAGS